MQDNRPPRWQLEYPAGIHVESRYNADGLRTKKTVTQSGASTVYEYLWNESRLVGQKVGNDAVRILYDANDEPVGFTVNDSASYFYVKNLQGDVLAIVDKTGAEKVSYVYDAYGQIVSMTGDATLQKLNPCTYRGYYYDAETGLYYLQSRYYNPEWGRFINADKTDILQISKNSVLNGNLYSYCNNNPINNVEISGMITPANIIGALVGAGAGALIGRAIANYFRLSGWKKWLVIGGSSALVAVAGWFAGPAIWRAIRPVLQTAVARGSLAVKRIPFEVSKMFRLVNIRQTTFSYAAKKHMSEAARKVPIQMLEKAIKYGRAARDTRGSKAIMYTIDMWKNGKKYKLEVLYDWSKRMILHFKYYR